jgi:hypothetical protein
VKGEKIDIADMSLPQMIRESYELAPLVYRKIGQLFNDSIDWEEISQMRDRKHQGQLIQKIFVKVAQFLQLDNSRNNSFQLHMTIYARLKGANDSCLITLGKLQCGVSIATYKAALVHSAQQAIRRFEKRLPQSVQAGYIVHLAMDNTELKKVCLLMCFATHVFASLASCTSSTRVHTACKIMSVQKQSNRSVEKKTAYAFQSFTSMIGYFVPPITRVSVDNMAWLNIPGIMVTVAFAPVTHTVLTHSSMHALRVGVLAL